MNGEMQKCRTRIMGVSYDENFGWGMGSNFGNPHTYTGEDKSATNMPKMYPVFIVFILIAVVTDIIIPSILRTGSSVI